MNAIKRRRRQRKEEREKKNRTKRVCYSKVKRNARLRFRLFAISTTTNVQRGFARYSRDDRRRRREIQSKDVELVSPETRHRAHTRSIRQFNVIFQISRRISRLSPVTGSKKSFPREGSRARQCICTERIYSPFNSAVWFVSFDGKLTPSRTLTSLTRDEDFGPNMNSTSRTRGRKLEPNINITSFFFSFLQSLKNIER